jgi:hypothetical protein
MDLFDHTNEKVAVIWEAIGGSPVMKRWLPGCYAAMSGAKNAQTCPCDAAQECYSTEWLEPDETAVSFVQSDVRGINCETFVSDV